MKINEDLVIKKFWFFCKTIYPSNLQHKHHYSKPLHYLILKPFVFRHESIGLQIPKVRNKSFEYVQLTASDAGQVVCHSMTHNAI